MKEYDIFTGGLDLLKKDIEGMKSAINKSNDEYIIEMVKDTFTFIGEEASKIKTYEERNDALNMNVVKDLTIGKKASALIVNTSQNATYAEYGTGIVGSKTPHTDPVMAWTYDMNNHGYSGWWYRSIAGVPTFTIGIPSQPFMFLTAQRLRAKSIFKYKAILERNGIKWD